MRTVVLKFWFTGVLALSAIAAANAGGVVREVPSPRFQPESLHLSLQNEVDAALSRAVFWLKGCQAADGHWGGSNRLATAYAVLALENSGATESAAQGRAWLKRAAGDATNNFWIALAGGAAVVPPLSHKLAFDKPYALDTDCFGKFSAEAVYLLAEINRAIPCGLVVLPAGWRSQLAARVVSSQRIAISMPGGGFWPETDTAADGGEVAQTALAMLVLQQL